MLDISKDFDKELIVFLEDSGFKNKNYMVSPASLRAVLTIAVAGADSDTKALLIRAIGFDDEDEMNDWYEKVSEAPNTEMGFLTFKLLNSAWHNTSFSGTFSDDYKKMIGDVYGAVANDVSSEKITDAVNKWVKDGTEGLISKISDDLSQTDLVLVNTLYLKSTWMNTFEPESTVEGDFVTFDGSIAKKDFMEQTDHFGYYEDSDGKFIVMQMDGDINAVFLLGDMEDVCGKMHDAEYKKVHVKLPKFETETGLANQEMVEFLKSRGAGIAFTPDADFSKMSDSPELYISDIVQKTRIKVDEDGIEAAAATSIMVLGAAPSGMPEEIKEFVADKPFRFYIVTDTDIPEILFCGQIVE